MTDPDRSLAAARRVLALIRDLRRRNEAWADGDPESIGFGNAIAASNPDVGAYDRRLSVSPLARVDNLLADAVAAIIGEEMARREEDGCRRAPVSPS
jgi:hypothetical protein